MTASACAGPPPGPPIVLRRPVATAHPRPRRPEPCEPVTEAKLTEAQKAQLFQEFDAYQRDRRPPGLATETALPPPGPLPKAKATTSRACSGTGP